MGLDDLRALGDIAKTFMKEAQEAATEYRNEIVASRELEELAAPTFRMKSPVKKELKGLKARGKKVSSVIQGRREGKFVTAIQKRKDTSQQFHHRNPELAEDELTKLAGIIKQSDSPKEIYDKVLQAYSDVTLADEALEFLIATRILETHDELKTIEEAQTWLHGQTGIEDDFLKNLVDTRVDLNVKHSREIVAGYHSTEKAREIADSVPEIARAAQAEGKTTTIYLRDMYRKVTHEQPEFDSLFNELSQKYSYQDMVKVSNFFYHSIGKDLNSEGPSIETGKLHALMHEVKILQAVMGVYRWWKGREALLEKQFAQNDLEYPSKTMNFETLSREFISLLSDRYPQSSKLIQSVTRLQVDKQPTAIGQVLAKILVIQQFRDAIPNVDNKRIPSLATRKEPFQDTIISTLEELEEDLADLETALENEEFFEDKPKAA